MLERCFGGKTKSRNVSTAVCEEELCQECCRTQFQGLLDKLCQCRHKVNGVGRVGVQAV